jgi:branched-subunit amino acid transport protein
MTPLMVFALAAVGTYAIRLTMLVVLAGRPLPRALVTPVGLVGPAAVGALTASALIHRGRTVEISTIVGTVVAFLIVRMTNHVTHGLVAGFAVVWAIKMLELL